MTDEELFQALKSSPALRSAAVRDVERVQRKQPGAGGAWPGAFLFLLVGVLGLWVLQAHGYVAVPIPMEMLTPQAQTMTPRPTMPPFQPAQQPAAPPQAPPTAAPQATVGAVIVVTPTFSTGCHDGVSYVDGVATNGTCAGAAFVGEAPTETTAPTPTIAPATAVPPDPTYMSVLQKQAPHCIRCAP